MRLRILTLSLFLGACAGGDENNECVGFDCPAPTMPLPGGSTDGDSGEEESDDDHGEPTSGASPVCTAADTACVGEQAIRYCNEESQQLLTIDCRGVCGPDRESLGCGPGDNGDVCYCGSPDTTETTETTETTGSGDEGEESSSGNDDDGGTEPCPDLDYPAFCLGQHGVPASCWSPGVDCTTVVECPDSYAACPAGYAVDCQELKCVELFDGYEMTNAQCTNNKDDDDNGYTDCSDLFCYIQNVTVCHAESTDYECNNGIDDDGDDFVDCADIACQMNPAVTVCGPQEWDLESCSNGVDDDGDGDWDCEDPLCINPYTQGWCW